MSIDWVFGILGTIASVSLALSPLATVRSIIASRTTGSFSVLPYSVTCFQAMLWVIYARLSGEGKEVLISVNVIVAVIELTYVLIFFRFAPAEQTTRLLFEIISPAAAMVIGLVVAFSLADKSRMIHAVGITAIVFNVAVYAAPMAIIVTVVRTKSVQYMPLLLSVTGTVGAGIWLGWSVIVGDTYVMIPSCAGVALGIIQLGVYATYYKKNEEDPSDSIRQEEVSALVQ